jgi:microcystin degradation protein MlrC
MRLAIGELWTESNSFSLLRTTRDRFTHVRGEELLEQFAGGDSEVGGFIDQAQAATESIELHPPLSARAVPGGPVMHDVYEEFASEIIAGLRDSDIDGVLLALHGCMVTDRLDDVEGDLLTRVRETVGEVPIVASLDHHAHVTPTMVEMADALVAYREHPHTDHDKRMTGERAANLVIGAMTDRIQPTTSLVKAPMVTTTHLDTTRAPLADLFAERERIETTNPDALAVSLCPVQPWVDLPGMGFSAIAVTDNAPQSATDYARSLAEATWTRRTEFEETFPSIDAVIDDLLTEEPGLAVLSDQGDITGGGAPGDSTTILRSLLTREDTVDLNAALPMVDPEAVAALSDADDGPQTVEVGGHLTAEFEPVQVTGEVVQTFTGGLALEGDLFDDWDIDVGRRVTLRLVDRDIWLVITEKPPVTTDPSFFTVHDVPVHSMNVLVVKSNYDFPPNFEPIADRIVKVDTPGVCSVDLTSFTFERGRPLFPFDDVEPAFEPVDAGP